MDSQSNCKPFQGLVDVSRRILVSHCALHMKRLGLGGESGHTRENTWCPLQAWWRSYAPLLPATSLVKASALTAAFLSWGEYSLSEALFSCGLLHSLTCSARRQQYFCSLIILSPFVVACRLYTDSGPS